VSVQAQFWCTVSRAKKVTASLTVVGLIAETINSLIRHLVLVEVVYTIAIAVAFRRIVPMAVLVLNVVVDVQVRRAASKRCIRQSRSSATSPDFSHQQLGRADTIMLIATSIIYVFLYDTFSILSVLRLWANRGGFTRETADVVWKCIHAAISVLKPVFAYTTFTCT